MSTVISIGLVDVNIYSLIATVFCGILTYIRFTLSFRFTFKAKLLVIFLGLYGIYGFKVNGSILPGVLYYFFCLAGGFLFMFIIEKIAYFICRARDKKTSPYKEKESGNEFFSAENF